MPEIKAVYKLIAEVENFQIFSPSIRDTQTMEIVEINEQEQRRQYTTNRFFL